MVVIGIIGSRNFVSRDKIYWKIRELEEIYTLMSLKIISGGARSNNQQIGSVCVDQAVKEICEESDITFNDKDYTPDRTRYAELGNQIYHDRNDKIIQDCELLIAFWNGEKHSGTYSVIKKCLDRRRNIEVVFD